MERQPSQPLPVDEALTILSQVGQALQYAHEQGIVHRDLKPENILLNAKDDVLLADFGIAVVLASGKTQHVGSGGTVPYMAPEQFEGTVSTRSDQYALGCIAYELLTGRRPFQAPNIAAMWFQHAKVEATPLRQLNPKVPAHIEQAILKAMAKNRTDRHANVAAFIAALCTPQKTKEQWLKEGNDHRNAKRYEEALAAYERAILLDPTYALAYYNKGFTLYNLKRYEESLAAYERAIQLNPNDADAYDNKGNALYDLKRYQEALAAYERAIQLDPNFAKAYRSKGIALDELKRYQEALAAYERAILLDPNYALAYHSKALALERLGRTKEAQLAREKARQLGYSG